jgi:DNA invertase Pin-like site-specific DNA recombinase
MISARTKAALAAVKARGQVLGGYRGGPVPDAHLGGKAVVEAADAFAARVAPIAREMQAAGRSLRQIAAELEVRGIMTARGAQWTAMAVKNVLARAAA